MRSGIFIRVKLGTQNQTMAQKKKQLTIIIIIIIILVFNFCRETCLEPRINDIRIAKEGVRPQMSMFRQISYMCLGKKE